MASDEPKQAIVSSPEEEQVVVTVKDVAQLEPEDETTTETKNVVENVADNKEEDEVTSHVKVESVTEIDTGDSNELPENEKKALAELKQLLQNALLNHEFNTSAPQSQQSPQLEEVPTVMADEEEEKSVEEKANDETVIDNKPEEVTSTKVTIDEDGTKTVEAIEETVVVQSVVADSEEQQTNLESTTQESSAVVSSPPAVTKHQEVKTTTTIDPPEELSIWGVPLFKDERTDTILWKFLRARDFKVNEAFCMIKSTIKWRKEFKIDELLEEDLGDDLEKAVFMHGFSKEGNPVCYNVYGAFQDKKLYQRTFSDEEKRQRFLKWRIQFLEKSIRKLDFHPGGISTIVQVNDLKNSPGPGKWELRQATKQALHLLQDNYPEFVAKQVFINVPWWYVAVNKMISPFLTQRTKSKFVVAGPSKSPETLFSYIAPEQVPVQYGGFSKGENGTKDGATQIIVKPSSKETVEFAVTEACDLTWEVRVLGWEVNYGAEFVPDDKDAYTVIIQKVKKVGPTEESIISNSFKTSEPGKIVLTIDNSSSKKKTLIYRLNSKPSCE